MPQKIQETGLNNQFARSVKRLETWAENPWRRYSLFLITLLAGFFIGSSIGMINGVLAFMDPVGAMIAVLFIELLVRIRRAWYFSNKKSLVFKITDMLRLGLVYGLFIEGFKLF